MNNDSKQPAARNFSIAALIVALLACIATFLLGIVGGKRIYLIFC